MSQLFFFQMPYLRLFSYTFEHATIWNLMSRCNLFIAEENIQIFFCVWNCSLLDLTRCFFYCLTCAVLEFVDLFWILDVYCIYTHPVGVVCLVIRTHAMYQPHHFFHLLCLKWISMKLRINITQSYFFALILL